MRDTVQMQKGTVNNDWKLPGGSVACLRISERTEIEWMVGHVWGGSDNK